MKETEPTIQLSSERYLVSALVENPEALTHLSELITNGGAEVVKKEDLGIRHLAFPIEKKNDLSLISVFFMAIPGSVKKIEQDIKQEGAIFKRFLLTRWTVDPNAVSNRKSRSKVKEEAEVEEEKENV